MRLALWTPHPDAAWVSALLPLLRREAEVALVPGEGARAPHADVHLYHVADEPAHAFVHRALRERPGLVLLADWGLARLAHASAAGHPAAYLAEARRAHGERGTFVARQILLGLGGEVLPSLLAFNDRVLDASLGLVAFTEYIRARAAARLPGRPVAHLPLAFVGREEVRPRRGEARGALGVPADAALVLALSAHSARVLERVRPGERVLVRAWPDRENEVPLALAAADVAVSLEFPPRGGLNAALVGSLAAGVPAFVSAGSAAAAEMEDGAVVKVSPGAGEADEVAAFLERLVRDPVLRRRVGGFARAHVDPWRRPERAAAGLLDLARDVLRAPPSALRAPAAVEAGTPLAWALDEVYGEGRDMGLVGLSLGAESLLRPLFGNPR